MTDALLTELAALAARRRDLDEQIRAVVAQAVAADVEIATLARTADVTRQTIYRWAQWAAGRINVADAIDGALALLLETASPATASAITVGLSTQQIDAKIRRLRLAVKNMPAQPGDDLRAALSVAVSAAAAAEDVRAKTGRWPVTVTLDVI